MRPAEGGRVAAVEDCRQPAASPTKRPQAAAEAEVAAGSQEPGRRAGFRNCRRTQSLQGYSRHNGDKSLYPSHITFQLRDEKQVTRVCS